MNRLFGAVFALAIVVAFASSAEAQVYQVYYPERQSRRTTRPHR